MKIALTALLIILITASLPGCSGNTTGNGEIPVNTEFGRMLGYVPYSFLLEHHIWYGDMRLAKETYGLEHLDNMEAVLDLPLEERSSVSRRLSGTVPAFRYHYIWVTPLIGWDPYMIDKAIYSGSLIYDEEPAWEFAVYEGDFDEGLIGEKLTAQGYEKDTYDSYTYYRINEDMGADNDSELGEFVQSDLNRVSVLDNTLVVAPATDIMTGILDTMSGRGTSAADVLSCQALADSLGNVLAAVMMTPERIEEINQGRLVPPFAEDWEPLHRYSLVGFGYRDDGMEQYIVISLYFGNPEDAEADAGTLVSRLESYRTDFIWEGMEYLPLIVDYDVGEPFVTPYDEGATLTVSLKYLPDEVPTRAISLVMIILTRDLMFLAPNPSEYVAD